MSCDTPDNTGKAPDQKPQRLNGKKEPAFVIATNLALLDEEILGFCAEEQIHISTSLDGPQDLHNSNRRRPGRDSRRWRVSGGFRSRSARTGSVR
jgi:uncharacterized protein